MMPLVETVKPYIIHYGYWAVFLGVFGESLGLPLPGETLIIVAGLVAAKGVLNFTWLVVIAVIATFVANTISYAAGYRGGRSFVIKYGKYIYIDEQKLQALENFFKRHGNKVVVIARFILGLRQLNGFIAGMAKMPFGEFAVFNLVGAVLWVGWWTGLAYYLGKRFAGVFVECYFFIGIFTLVALIIMIFRYSRPRSS